MRDMSQDSPVQMSFDVPRDARYFEDYVPGSCFQFGGVEVHENEIIEFAAQFDPQPIHLDRDAAESGPFRGIIASGWHTIGLMMRLFVEHYLTSAASMASPGVDEVRWSVPLRPGDQLQVRITITEARPSRTKADRGLVHSFVEAVNQRDEVVASFKAMNIIGKRPSASRQ
ncbi:enoyl-CoA hydratase [Paracoccus denitrificans]|nr:enoyl-CoA hydratase [Paracoccus denitrificans]